MFINKTRNVLNMNKFNEEAKGVSAKILAVLKFGDDDLRFELSEALLTAEESLLDSFIAAFVDSDPDDETPVIYDLVKHNVKGQHFHYIDYKTELTQRLQRKTTIIQGEVQKVEWYKNAVIDMSLGIPILAYTDKVLEVNNSYVRDSSGFVVTKSVNRRWVNRNNELNSDVKDSGTFYYEDFHKIQEGKKRRDLLVDSIQFPTLYAMIQVLVPRGYTPGAALLKGRNFMDDYEIDFSKFKHNSSTITNPASPDFGMKSIVVKLRDESDIDHSEWLDLAPAMFGGATTIRQYLMAEFSI